MDTTLNISTEAKSSKLFLNNNFRIYSETLKKLEDLSSKAKNHLKNLIIKDERIDNILLEKHHQL